MIWVVLGGAVGVWTELTRAQALVDGPLKTIAVNEAGIFAPCRVDAWATLHPEKWDRWTSQRHEYGNTDYEGFSIERSERFKNVRDKWGGSSGLYAVQIALQEFGASGVILCGVPLTPEGRHFFDKNHPWSDADTYRKGFGAALPVIKEKVRSMSGWTQELLGAPSTQWLIDRAKAHINPTGVING
jgi:hypothetical protein